jgi:hypothetical protein
MIYWLHRTDVLLPRRSGGSADAGGVFLATYPLLPARSHPGDFYWGEGRHVACLHITLACTPRLLCYIFIYPRFEPRPRIRDSEPQAVAFDGDDTAATCRAGHTGGGADKAV